MADLPTVGAFEHVRRLPRLIHLLIAIDMVEIESNTSVIVDEQLAHRLGMVPLYSPQCEESIRYTRVRTLQAPVLSIFSPFQQDCTCDTFCQNCAIELVLNISCNESRTLDVTSNHLEVVVKDPYSYIDPLADELRNRPENFGHPVGKSESPLDSHLRFVFNPSR